LLRFETPLQVLTRGVPEEMDFAGRWIGPNQLLFLMVGAANRDPEQFSNPDRLDLMRKPNRHLSFGFGPHGCVGAWLARFGLAIALGAILRRQSELCLARGKLDWNFPAMRRTVRALPVLVKNRKYLPRRHVPDAATACLR
jgi:cytochrome P450